MSGTAPGLSVDAFVLPLNLDAYLLFTLEDANGGPLVNTFGTLSAEGTNPLPVSFELPAGLDPALAGSTLHHAYLVLDVTTVPGSPFVSFVSNAVPLTLLP